MVIDVSKGGVPSIQIKTPEKTEHILLSGPKVATFLKHASPILMAADGTDQQVDFQIITAAVQSLLPEDLHDLGINHYMAIFKEVSEIIDDQFSEGGGAEEKKPENSAE